MRRNRAEFERRSASHPASTLVVIWIDQTPSAGVEEAERGRHFSLNVEALEVGYSHIFSNAFVQTAQPESAVSAHPIVSFDREVRRREAVGAHHLH